MRQNRSGSFIEGLLRRDKNSEPDSSRRLLPSPPDVRKVIITQCQPECQVAMYEVPPSMQPSYLPRVQGPALPPVGNNTGSIVERTVPREVISPDNTTIIGDYVVTAFMDNDTKWLVQVFGNATWQSVIDMIKQDAISVDKRYTFFVVGHNQVWSATKQQIINWIHELVVLVHAKNADTRMYFSMVLPRPLDNEIVKPKIVNFNRNMFAAVYKVGRVRGVKIHFLPVQHSFIGQSKPILVYYNEDLITLNQAGAAMLKMKLFEFAGFRVNL